MVPLKWDSGKGKIIQAEADLTCLEWDWGRSDYKWSVQGIFGSDGNVLGLR